MLPGMDHGWPRLCLDQCLPAVTRTRQACTAKALLIMLTMPCYTYHGHVHSNNAFHTSCPVSCRIPWIKFRQP